MRWLSARTHVEIPRPIDDVWDFLTSVGRLDEWMGGVSEPRVTSDGPFGLGSTFASRYTYRDETVDVDYRVTHFDPPRAYAIESAEGAFPYRAAFTLEPTDAGTRVTKEISSGTDSTRTTLMFIFMRPIIRSMMRREIRFELARLSDAVQAVRD